MLKFKRIISLFVLSAMLLTTVVLAGCNRGSSTNTNTNASPMVGNSSDEYYMIVFLSGIEYFKSCYKGFEAAAKLYGVKPIYTGATTTDINQEVTVFDQVIAKNPKGIAVACVDPDALKVPIQKAIAAGIPVVTFDSDSPDSGRPSFLGTGNVGAGTVAGKTLAEAVGPNGKVATISIVGSSNQALRLQGFKDELAQNYKGVQIIDNGDDKGDTTTAAQVASAMMQAHPDINGFFAVDATAGVGIATAVKEAGKTGTIKIVSFDTDSGTLDLVKSGAITATMAQGTYNEGFHSMNFLYLYANNLDNPVEGWKAKNIDPLPASVDTGVTVVTKDNADLFYFKQ